MKSRVVLAGALGVALLIPSAAMGQAGLPEKAAQAVAAGQTHARAEAKGENGNRGLEQASEALDRAAERSNGKAGGNGNAFGKGRAAEVHAILLAGGSPSDLPSHGEAVSALARAYGEAKGKSATAGNNGKGLGHGKGGDGAPDEGDDD